MTAQGKGEDYLSGVVLLQSLQKLVDENERLKAEITQKSDTIDSLRDKIAKLHEKNEKYYCTARCC